MTPDRWRQIEVVFHEAAELPPAQRVAYLDEACSADPTLRAEVERLLEAEVVTLPFADAIASVSVSLPRHGGLEGEIVGPYRILNQIGQGGMGTVYKAVRSDGEFEQFVAIKIIRPALAQSQVEERFRAERQILAQLTHPNIGRLIDGGSHLQMPYLVMEFIEGEPIDVWCRERKLSTRQRLELFRGVCAAVQHAHQRLIVHRDLKPSNILVQSDGSPKLLDFGIAKLLDDPAGPGPERTLTQTGWLLMTPDYASPEQVRGETITVASDIYSLGVVLYELLTGDRPYRLKNYSPAEIQQLVCTAEVPAPSSQVTKASRLRRQLSGDLDNVLLMALRKEPERRYQSVEQMSEDIRRHLAGETVIARRDTYGYRTSKFIRRNRLALVLGGLLIAAIVTGTVMTVREGMRAQKRFLQVRELANKVLNEFDTAASKLTGSSGLRRLMVQESLNYLDGLALDVSSDPELQMELARAYHRIGDIQGHGHSPNLGLRAESLESHLKALKLEEPLLARLPGSIALKRSAAAGYAHASDLLSRRGDRERADLFLAKANALVSPEEPQSFADVRLAQARKWLLEGKIEESLRASKAAVDAAMRIEDPSRAFAALYETQIAYRYLGRPAEGLGSVRAAKLLADAKRDQWSSPYFALAVRANLAHGPALMGDFFFPNEERFCEAAKEMRPLAEASETLLLGDLDNLGAKITVASNYLELAREEAACGLPSAVATAEHAIEVIGKGKSTNDMQLEFVTGLAYAHFKAGHPAKALAMLEPLAKTKAQAADFSGEFELALGHNSSAITWFALGRKLRQPTIKAATYERYTNSYDQAMNILLALKAGDKTPGLKAQALELLKEFPERGAARSIERLRRDLRGFSQ